MDRHPIQEGVEILLLASRYRNQNDDGPLGSYADINIYIRVHNPIQLFSCYYELKLILRNCPLFWLDQISQIKFRFTTKIHTEAQVSASRLRVNNTQLFTLRIKC